MHLPVFLDGTESLESEVCAGVGCAAGKQVFERVTQDHAYARKSLGKQHFSLGGCSIVPIKTMFAFNVLLDAD